MTAESKEFLELTDQEEQLIKAFRRLSAKQKAHIVDFSEFLGKDDKNITPSEKTLKNLNYTNLIS